MGFSDPTGLNTGDWNTYKGRETRGVSRVDDIFFVGIYMTPECLEESFAPIWIVHNHRSGLKLRFTCEVFRYRPCSFW